MQEKTTEVQRVGRETSEQISMPLNMFPDHKMMVYTEFRKSFICILAVYQNIMNLSNA